MTFRAVLTAIVALALAPAAAARGGRLPSAQTIPGNRRAPARELRDHHAERRARRARGRLDRRQRHPGTNGLGLDRRLPARIAPGGPVFRSLRRVGRPHAPGRADCRGTARPQPTEKHNQPIYLQVVVPDDAKPGGYAATVHVTADGISYDVPVAITVFPVRLPAPTAIKGNLLTAFHVVPQSYVKEAERALPLQDERAARRGERQALPVPLGLPHLARELGLRRAALRLRVHVLVEVVARRRREHGPSERGRLPDDADPDLEPAHERCEPDRRRSRPSNPRAGARTCSRSTSTGTTTAGSPATSPTSTRSTSPSLAGMSLVRRQAASAAQLLPGLEGARHREPDTVEPLPLGQQGRRRRRHLGRAVPPLLRPVRDPRERIRTIEQARRAGKSIWSYTFDGPRAPRATR